MTAFLKLLVASLKEIVRDRTTLSFTLIMPLLLVAFFGFAYRQTASRLALGVTVTGRSAAASRIIGDLRRERAVKIELSNRRNALARLRNGSVDAVLVASPRSVLSTHSHETLRWEIYYGTDDGVTTLAARALAQQVRAHTIGKTLALAPIVALAPVAGVANARLDYVVPGLLGLAIMWLGIFAAIPLVQQREQQVLRRFAVTPLPRIRLVGAQVLGRLLVSLAQAIFILLAARVFFGVPIGVSGAPLGVTVGELTGLVLLGALSFVAIGYAVAALSPTQHSAHAWAQLLSMPMLVLCGVFFPISDMPGILRPLIDILPLTYLADALRQTALSGQHLAPLSLDLAWLAAWAAIALGAAVRYFRWSP